MLNTGMSGRVTRVHRANLRRADLHELRTLHEHAVRRCGVCNVMPTTTPRHCTHCQHSRPPPTAANLVFHKTNTSIVVLQHVTGFAESHVPERTRHTIAATVEGPAKWTVRNETTSTNTGPRVLPRPLPFM